MQLQNEEYYLGFRDGDETALNYVYSRYYRALLHHGKRIVNDEFAASCIVQEAFLKGWKFRESMESMKHIYCFIRLDVNWKCYAYLRNPSNRFHRSVVGGEAVEYYNDHVCEYPAETVSLFDEEKLKAIEEALPYLPANRQTIMTLYFRYGLSYKRIAKRFGTSNQAISVEVRKSLESLKRIVHAQKKLSVKAATTRKAVVLPSENMDAEMQQIFRLRYEQKYSFATIAEKMDITQEYVQQQYIIAHRRLRELHQHSN